MEALILPRHASALAPSTPQAPDFAGGGPFWCGALGDGAALVLELVPAIDAVAPRLAQLPVCPALTRPLVGQYLSMVRTLAAAWTLHSRPALLSSIGALLHVGDSLAQPFTLEAMAARADGGRGAQRALEALQRRLAAPLAAFGALAGECAGARAQMARVAAELDADTRLVSQRLQADQVHAFLMAQQASALQGQRDDAAMRAQAHWLAGPPHGGALEAVQRQLGQLRADQGATRAEAAYLHSQLPALAPYLAALERLGGGLDAILAGARTLARQLAQLQQELDSAADGAAAPALQAALPHWQALSAAAARLQPRA